MEKINQKRKKIKVILMIILVVAFIASMTYLVLHFYNSKNNKDIYLDLQNDITMEEISKTDDRFIEKVKALQQENSDIKGWIRIEDTNINYPLLQGTDNEYYLNHNYKKEKSSYGSIYINCNSDIKNINSNIIIYGHDMKDEQMFQQLIKYQDKEFYDTHSTITIATDEEESEYKIICVFKSRIFYKNETNVFRYYQYYNFENETKYKEYLSNCKALQLYDTGLTAEYGEQLITLITCEYSQDNGRMVVIAKKI